MAEKQNVICFCPNCHEEAFDVNILESGKGFDQEYGEVHWFSGYGKCNECGHESDYSDSSH